MNVDAVVPSGSTAGGRTAALTAALGRLVEARVPGARLVSVRALGADGGDNGTHKALGYGQPLRLTVRRPDGATVDWVLHTATTNEYGHDRRADRAAEMLLAYDTFATIPRHVEALDVGAVCADGRLLSLKDAGEVYLLTTWGEGHLYADELRAIATRGSAGELDIAHAAELGAYLAQLHEPREGATAYRRAIRDLLGSGEGIFGIIDGYPEHVPGASVERLYAIESRCLSWRWRMKSHADRLARIHGDFHPFNALFDPERGLTLLDASRGSLGDPADDATAMAINYLFFALQSGAWDGGFRPLWRAFWDTYFHARPDDELLALAPPYFTWRALVLSNPRWYPDIEASVRERLLTIAERALDQGCLNLDAAEELCR